MGYIEIEKTEFNKKLKEKMENGFIPDLSLLKKNDFFIKQFWREPYIANSVVKKTIQHYIDVILKFCSKKDNIKVLDVGCGSGYITIELARHGFHVTGIDISDRAIDAAKSAAANNKNPMVGTLSYFNVPFEDIKDTYDVVLFSASLHHMPEIEKAIQHALNILNPGGLIVCLEPSPCMWKHEDAVPIALVRAILSATGHWYDPKLGDLARNAEGFKQIVNAVFMEMTENKDEFTPNGQSEYDDMKSGKRIEAALIHYADLVYNEPAIAFRHNGMAGVRGTDNQIQKLTDILMMFEQYAMDHQLIRANCNLMVARKK